ncbi:hypothetical protein ACU4GD_23865 [Cupriavidus basilensis]
MLTGTLPTLSREAAKEMLEAAGAKVAWFGVEERPTTWWPARKPAANWKRPRRSACLCLTRPPCWPCWPRFEEPEIKDDP